MQLCVLLAGKPFPDPEVLPGQCKAACATGFPPGKKLGLEPFPCGAVMTVAGLYLVKQQEILRVLCNIC